jgi:hypothetical protein
MSPLRLNGSTSGNVTLDAPAVAGNNTLVLPTGNGTSGQVLTTNGSGALSWGGAGKILQVVQATKTDTFTTTSTTFTDVTGLSVSITPSSASNKVLLLAMIGYGGPVTDSMHLKFLVGSTDLLIGDAASNRIRTNFSKNNYNIESDAPGSHFTYLHSPASTSSQTYKVQIRSAGGGTVTINRTGFDGDTSSYGRFASTMIAMEVAA